MAFNEDTSFIEYNVEQPTQDFVTNFDTIGGTTDVVLVTVDGVLTDTPESSYTVQQINHTTWRVTPEVQTGSVVRLYRVTNIDEMMHVFTAGAKFIARNMDNNFKQIRHSQQEVRDAFDYLEYNTLGVVEAAKDATELANTAAQAAYDAAAQVTDELELDASFVVDASGKTQQQINTGLFNLYNPLSLHHTPTELSANFASLLNALIDKVSLAGGGTISVPDGEYWVNPTAAIVMKDNVHLKLGHSTVIKALPTRSGDYDLIRMQDVENTKVTGGRLIGDRYTHLAPNGSYYKDWQPNTYYEAGEYICHQYNGCLVLVSGTTGATRPDLLPAGTTYTDGTCQYQYKENVGEWGYGIMIRGGKNNIVEDVIADEFWGDSLLISRSPNKDYAEDVTVNNFVANRSRRQGITVGSVKGLRINNVELNDISGTLPMSGIDFEPDLGVQWLQDIVVDGVRTNNCEGDGVKLSKLNMGWSDWSSTVNYKTNRDVVRYQGVMYQAKTDNSNSIPSASSPDWGVLPDYDITEDRVSIEIRNHVDRGSTRGFYALGSQNNSNTKGYVKVINPSYRTKDNHCVFIQNNNGNGVQFYFEDPEFINNCATNIQHVRLSNAPSDFSLGGVHLIRPRFKCLGIDTECFYIFANNSNGLPNINISIIDIVERPTSIISPVNMISRDTVNVVTSDRYNKLRLNSKVSLVIQLVAVQHEYYIDGTPAAFGINSVRKGSTIRIVNEYTGLATISMNIAGGDIEGITNSNTRSFTIAAGGSVELFAISSTLLRVVRSNGIYSSAKASRGTIPFPSTSFAANESKLIATVTTLTANRYTDVVSVSSTMNLNGDIALSAIINTDGTISIYGTNLKASPLSYGAPEQYLNVVVS